MNNIALGQYVDGRSFIHRLDPRTKLLSLMLLMVAVFLIPKPNDSELGKAFSFIMLGAFFIVILIIVLFTQISLIKYLNRHFCSVYFFDPLIQILDYTNSELLA